MDYTTIASQKSLARAVDGLRSRNFEPILVRDKAEALAKIKELIPPGASVMNGSSTTLVEIGFVDYLKDGAHGWNNLHADILAEKDPDKQALLRRQSVLSEYYLGSVHAITEEGEMLIASNSGSQLPHLAFTSNNVILVAGTQKIVPTLNDAFKRLEEHVVPMEDERLMKTMGFHTMNAKNLVLRHENAMLGRKVRVILIAEKLGF